MRRRIYCLMLIALIAGGCSTPGNSGNLQSYAYPAVEPKWIRDGMPIEFEEDFWYPADDIEILEDSEVYPLGEYEGVAYFAAKTDVRPFERIYTKFDQNKFRYYEISHD